MSLKGILLAGAVLALLGNTAQTDARSKEATLSKASICQALGQPERFNWKLVEIHGTYSGTWEGAWIGDTECRDVLGEVVLPFQRTMDESRDAVVRRVSKKYGFTDVIRDKGWNDFDYASNRLFTGPTYKLADGTMTRGQYDYVAADFTGVLVMKQAFRVEHGFGNGWGHLGMSRFLLVLRSVSNVTPHPIDDDSGHRAR